MREDPRDARYGRRNSGSARRCHHHDLMSRGRRQAGRGGWGALLDGGQASARIRPYGRPDLSYHRVDTRTVPRTRVLDHGRQRRAAVGRGRGAEADAPPAGRWQPSRVSVGGRGSRQRGHPHARQRQRHLRATLVWMGPEWQHLRRSEPWLLSGAGQGQEERVRGAAQQGDEADEARSGTRNPNARCRCVGAPARNRAHRLAAYRQCSVDAGARVPRNELKATAIPSRHA